MIWNNHFGSRSVGEQRASQVRPQHLDDRLHSRLRILDHHIRKMCIDRLLDVLGWFAFYAEELKGKIGDENEDD